jgi:hypothetical protein
MPRFTVGSLAAGVALATIAIWLIESRATFVKPMVTAPTPRPSATDPATGAVVVGPGAANDYPLQDAYDWSGGQDAATW